MSAPIDCLATLRRPVFLVNSRLGLVTAAPVTRHPFSRSYGVNLPSSLERVIPRPLVFSTCLPVSVSGTGLLITYVVRAFLGRKILYIKYQIGTCASTCTKNSYRITAPFKTSFSSCYQHLARLHQIPILANVNHLRPSVLRSIKHRNINLFAIDYAFRPRLRAWLTLHGRA